MSVAWKPELWELPPKEAEQSETTGDNSSLSTVTRASDPTPIQVLRAVEVSGTLDFWDDPAEDVYTSEDGEPL